MTKAESYNERLFSRSGLRSFIHNARFLWARKTLGRISDGPFRAVELGCFDGRLLHYFPTPPTQYDGFDAGWEGGLEQGRKNFPDHAEWRFHLATEPSHLRIMKEKSCNVGISLETLEHVPPELVGPYLDELARIIDGHFLVTVPNEKGLVFLLKWIAKKAAFGGAQQFTFREVVAATLGRLDQVERDDHKGFDYEVLAREIAQRFDVISVSSVTVGWLPRSMSLTIGILARTKTHSGVRSA